MAKILLDVRMLRAYDGFKAMCALCLKPDDFCDKLWNEFLDKPALYEEYEYYIKNKDLRDSFSFEGYSLTDVYVYILTKYKLVMDKGKNGLEESKEPIILDSFMFMAEFMNEPDKYRKKLEEGKGMDFF